MSPSPYRFYITFMLEKVRVLGYDEVIMLEIFTLAILGGLGILFLLIILLSSWTFRLKKRLDVFTKNGSKNLEEFLAKQLVKSEKQDKQIKEMLKEIARLSAASERSFQKIGVVRFNPFKEVGGDQSFSLALLDAQNNGFVVTSLYEKETNRVYAKPIEQGASKYPLSDEEKKAIGKAMS